MKTYLNGIGSPYDFKAYSEIPNNKGRLLKTNVGEAELVMHWEPRLHELTHIASLGWYFDPYSYILATDDFAPVDVYVYRVPHNNQSCCEHSSQPAVLGRYEPDSKTFIPRFVPWHRGGAVLVVTSDNDFNISIGVSVCSMKETFSFADGARMAYDRALGRQEQPKIINQTLKMAYKQIKRYYSEKATDALLNSLVEGLRF